MHIHIHVHIHLHMNIITYIDMRIRAPPAPRRRRRCPCADRRLFDRSPDSSGSTKRATSGHMPLLRLQSSEGKFTMSCEIEPVRRSFCRHCAEVARLRKWHDWCLLVSPTGIRLAPGPLRCVATLSEQRCALCSVAGYNRRL